MLSGERVIGFLKDRARRPLSFRELSSMMGLSSPERRSLKRILRELVDEGRVVRTRKGLYGPALEMSLVTGYFEAHRDGFGFVIQDKPGERDIFIPGRASLSAMNNDRVMCRVDDPVKRVGRIVRILDRAHSKITGTIDISPAGCFVKPKNRATGFDILIPPAGAKGLKHGQPVIAVIEQYPEAGRFATGSVEKILEPPETPKDYVDAVIEEFSLPVRFGKAASAEARGFSEKGFGDRRDLRALPTVTIDGERARDFDDAISISRREGGYTLWVHIADVGHYVHWDSALDTEARARGTSVYFPDRVIPMLPKELSEDLCSLKPGLDRPAFTVEMQIGPKGRRSGAKFYKSLIKSDHRMTYTSVRRIVVDHDEDERTKYEGMLDEFDLMSELAGLMRDSRLGRGSLDFDLPEPEIILDMQGRPEAIVRAERSFAHMIIEEFMIAANEAVAEYLTSRSLPCLYRVHEAPDISKVEEVYRFAGLLGVPKKAIPPPGASTASLFRLLKAAKGIPEEELLNYLVLRTMKQARYSEYNAGHFGLASRCYLHFTSPIRRYPDLVCHRILDEAISGGSGLERLSALLPDIAAVSSRTERTAMEAERQVIEVMRAWFMKDKLGDVFPSTITGVSQAGIRIRLNEYYVEGFIKVSDMTDDYYQYDERSAILRGRNSGRTFRFGGKAEVRLDSVDIDARALLFGLVSGGAVERQAKKKPRRQV